MQNASPEHRSFSLCPYRNAHRWRDRGGDRPTWFVSGAVRCVRSGGRAGTMYRRHGPLREIDFPSITGPHVETRWRRGSRMGQSGISFNESNSYRLIIERLTDGVVMLDRQARCLYLNPAATRILERTDTEL